MVRFVVVEDKELHHVVIEKVGKHEVEVRDRVQVQDENDPSHYEDLYVDTYRLYDLRLASENPIVVYGRARIPGPDADVTVRLDIKLTVNADATFGSRNVTFSVPADVVGALAALISDVAEKES